MFKKLSILDITLCASIGVVLLTGIGAAVGKLISLSLISSLVAIGLIALFVVKNGNRISYLSTRTRNTTSRIMDIGLAVDSIKEEQLNRKQTSLDHSKRNETMVAQILTDIEKQGRAYREQLRSMHEEILVGIQNDNLSTLQESMRLSVEVKHIREDLQRLIGLEPIVINKFNDIKELIHESLLHTRVSLDGKIESEFSRFTETAHKRSDDIQTSQAYWGNELSSRIHELSTYIEVARSSGTDVFEALTLKLSEQLTSATEELRKIPTLFSNFDSSDQLRELNDGMEVLGETTKAEIAKLLVGLQDVSNGAVARLTKVTANEGLLVRRQLWRHISDTVTDSTRQLEGIAKLLPRLSEVNPLIPPTGGYALDSQALLHLIDVLERVRPSIIVEFGGGASTIWMAYICKKFNTRIISIDHLEEYLESTKKEVERHGFSDMVECRLAPLETIKVDGTEYSWYSRAELSDLSEIDLLFIDGPPEYTGPNARRPAMHIMASKLNMNAVVILDDTHRESEQETIRDWISAYPNFYVVDDNISRLSVLVSNGDAT